MPTLFMLYRPGPTRRKLAFKLAKPGDAIILIREAIVAPTHATDENEIGSLTQRGVMVFALKNISAGDLCTINGVKNIEYDQLVDLLVKYDRVFS
jgi:sulfur relay protein TusB/DsrH